MTSDKQWDDAKCRAVLLKQKCDYLMGEGWCNNPELILMYDYKRAASPELETEREASEQLRTLWDKLGFERAWLEEAIDASKDSMAQRRDLEAVARYDLCLHAQGVRPLPPLLADWMAKGFPSPTSRGSRVKRRDEVLAKMVAHIMVKVGIKPTRNEANDDTHRRSACDAVAKATNCGYHQVLEAWKKLRRDDDFLMPLPDPDPELWVRWGDTWFKAKREYKSRSEQLSELEGWDRDPFERVEDFDPLGV